MDVENAMTTGQVARRLNLSNARIVQLANDGVLIAHQTRLGRLFEIEQVEQVAKEREANPPKTGPRKRLA